MPRVKTLGFFFGVSSFGTLRVPPDRAQEGQWPAQQRRPFFGGSRFASSAGVATQGAASDFPVTALCLFAGRVKIVGSHQLAWTIHAQLALVADPARS
jgi:hypothetical protein